MKDFLNFFLMKSIFVQNGAARRRQGEKMHPRAKILGECIADTDSSHKKSTRNVAFVPSLSECVFLFFIHKNAEFEYNCLHFLKKTNTKGGVFISPPFVLLKLFYLHFSEIASYSARVASLLSAPITMDLSPLLIKMQALLPVYVYRV